jgi:hypothetical protein
MNGLTKWFGVTLVTFLAACSAAPAPSGDGDATEGDELGVNAKGQFCGGFGNFPCPEKYTCVDDTTDDCDPANGGADCGGVCERNKKAKNSACDDPNRSYVATSPETCMLVKFYCESGEAFFDDCGCGCVITPGTPCGDNVCGAGEYCCNPSCGICAPEGGFCTQQFCESALCTTEDCGPALGMANYLCADGVTVAGPTGVCQSTGGGCGWEIAYCPE